MRAVVVVDTKEVRRLVRSVLAERLSGAGQWGDLRPPPEADSPVTQATIDPAAPTPGPVAKTTVS